MSYRAVFFTVFLALALVNMGGCGPSSVAEDEERAETAGVTAADLDPVARRAADDWLALVDADDFQGSWQATGQLFRDEVSLEEWQDSMTTTREEIGGVTGRELSDHTLETVMPGAPEGEYMMLEYRSVFERQLQGAELVVLMRQPDGSWQVIGYFLQ